MSDYQKHIDQIRHQYEKVGDVAYTLDNQIANSVHDYSSPFPFLLELIQNAVDSASQDSRVVIDVSLRQENGHFLLVIANNGDPFSIGDIDRLCGMVRERKNPKKIGYKGLGFKTVTHITDNPRIFSRGCQFEFSQRYYPEHRYFWILVPHWMDASAVPSYIRPQSHWTTFVLPVREGIDVPALAQAIESLAAGKGAALLLFLDNLDELKISSSKTSASIRKQIDAADPRIRSIAKSENNGDPQPIRTWIVTHYPLSDNNRALSIPEAAAEEYSRKRGQAPFPDKAEGAVQPIITLAFGIIRDYQGIRLSLREGDRGALCAYFPVPRPGNEYVADYNGTGLRFAVQADFLTTQNRETLLPGSRWNRWIISHLPEAIESAVQEFKQNPGWHALIYDSMPCEDEGKGLFLETTQKLCNRIRELPIILTDSPAPNQWCVAREAVWPDKTELREIISDGDLAILKQDKKRWISSAIQTDGPTGARTVKFLGPKGLDIERFKYNQLLDYLVNQTWIDTKTGDIAWFEKVFAHIAKFGMSDKYKENLARTRVVPTTNGVLATLREVYFTHNNPAITLSDALFVHERLAQNRHIRQYLSGKLRVADGTYEALIDRIIIPRSTPEQRPEVLSEYVRFVKAYYDSGGAQRDLNSIRHGRIKGCLLLQETNGSWCSAAELRLPADQRQRPGTSIVRYPDAANRESWDRFFQWLGISPTAGNEDSARELTLTSPPASPLEPDGASIPPYVPGPPDTPAIREVEPPQVSEQTPDINNTSHIETPSRLATSVNPFDNSSTAPLKEPLAPYETQRIGCKGEALALAFVRKELLEIHSDKPALHLDERDNGFTILNGDRIIAEAFWPNAGCVKSETHEESGLHYDFQVTDTNGSVDYYEVKSTERERLDRDDLVELTAEEWAFAQEHGSRYHIIRVYNVSCRENAGAANKAESEIFVIDNPFRLLQEGALSVNIKHSSQIAFHASRKVI